MKIFFCSDTHFGHFNILKYEPKRVLEIFNYLKSKNINVEKMTVELMSLLHTEMLVSRWNEVVSNDDIVYFLGDFALCNNKEAEKIGRRLNGHKVIILGNHDYKKHKYSYTLEKHFKACGFERVEFNPIILKGKFILSHEPIDINNNFYYNIYGHVHSNEQFETKTDSSFCCCLDRHNYYPVELEEFNTYERRN